MQTIILVKESGETRLLTTADNRFSILNGDIIYLPFKGDFDLVAVKWTSGFTNH